MNNTIKTILFWVLAFIITATAAVYQKTTGPTYPKKAELKTNNNTYMLKLVRSHGGESDCPICFVVGDNKISAKLSYRQYPTNSEWTVVDMKREGDKLTGSLPHQPPAGKVEYKVDFYEDGTKLNAANEFYTITRFKGAVPGGILIPHIFFMFFAMMLSNFTAIMAFAKREKAVFYGWLTLAFLTLGGMIFGPIVQLYAFGDLWTGVPFGWDLTDNKTLIAFVAWIAALLMYRKQKKLGWLIAAAVVLILIFSIPHSMFGSELDYASGSVTQG